MIPLELTITDFRSYRGPETVDFKGLSRVCIVGNNGSGKSTLITAMLWALFGKSPMRGHGELIRTGADSAMVEFTFAVGQEIFRVLRTAKQQKSGIKTEAALVRITEAGDEEPLDDSVISVNRTVQRILGMDYDTFTSASVLLQGQADSFSAMAPANRKELLANILGLSLCEEIATLARSKARGFDAKGSARSEELTRISEELEALKESPKELEAAQKETEAVKESIKAAKKLVENARQNKEKLASALSELAILDEKLKAKADELGKIEREKARLEMKLQELKEKISHREEIESQAKEFDKLSAKDKELDNAKSSVLDDRNRILILEKEIAEWESELREEIAELRERKNSIQRELKDLRPLLARKEKLTEAHKEFVAANEALTALRKNREEGEDLERKIAALKANIAKEEASIKTQIGEKEALAQKLQSDIERNPPEQIEKEIFEIGRRLEELAKLEEQKDAIKEEADAAKSRIAAITSEIKGLVGLLETDRSKLDILEKSETPNCPLCNQPLDEEHREAVDSELKGKILATENLLEEIDLKKTELTRKVEEFRKKWKELNAVIESGKDLPKRHGELTEQLKSIQKSKDELQNTMTRIKELRSKLKKENFCIPERQAVRELQDKFETVAIPKEAIVEAEKNVEKFKKKQAQFDRIADADKREKKLKTEFEKTRRELEKTQAKLEQQKEIAEQKGEIEKLTKKIEEVGYDESAHNEIKKRLAKIATAPENLQKLEQASAKTEELEEQIREKQEKHSAIQEEIENLKNERAEKSKGLPDKKIVENEIARAESAHDKAVEKHRAALVALTEAKVRVEEMKKLEGKQKELKDEIDKVSETARLHRLLGEIMGKKGVPAFVIARALPEIDLEADRLLSLLTGNELALKLTTFRGEDGKEGETLDIRIADEDNERPYESFSGGETFRVDFAIRLAISRFLARRSGQPLSTLIIDEGFGTQDTEGLSLLAEAIRVVEPEFALILVITHLENFKEEFEQVIEVRKIPQRGSVATVYA